MSSGHTTKNRCIFGCLILRARFDALSAAVPRKKYLGSGLIKGVGPKFAKKIVQRFGVDTFVVIEDNIEFLVEIEGIGKKRIRMIAESWEKQKEVKNIMLFLQKHQVSTSTPMPQRSIKPRDPNTP